jgi:tRNA 2-thiocytidine biosynthesis protein TtcA
MNLDQKQPGFPGRGPAGYLEQLGIDYRIVEQDTYAVVKDKLPPGKTTCSLCSRLRRGVIYRTAKELGANKIALGHHRDDIVHTLFLNLLFRRPAQGDAAEAGHRRRRACRHSTTRLLREADIARFARGMAYPIIPCNLCGSQDNLQRQKIREMMADWDRRFPGRTEVVFSALQKVVPSHLADQVLFDFKGLQCAGEVSVVDGGDVLFDPPPLAHAGSSPLPVVSR